MSIQRMAKLVSSKRGESDSWMLPMPGVDWKRLHLVSIKVAIDNFRKQVTVELKWSDITFGQRLTRRSLAVQKEVVKFFCGQRRGHFPNSSTRLQIDQERHREGYRKS